MEEMSGRIKGFEPVPVEAIAEAVRNKNSKREYWITGELTEGEPKVMRIQRINHWRIDFETEEGKESILNVESRETEPIIRKIQEAFGKREEVILLKVRKKWTRKG